MPLIARALAAKGAVIREGCKVRGLDLQAGRVTGVVTESGRIACEAVVLAGGAWSALMLRSLGVALPQLSVMASVGAAQPIPPIAGPGQETAFADAHMGIRRRDDGGYTMAPGGRHVGRVMADLVTGDATGHDLHRFRFSRFSDGSTVDLGDAL